MRKLSGNLYWDIFCFGSLLGIWPRFIEPRLLLLSSYFLPIERLQRELEGFKIVQLSDLHFNEQTAESLLKKIADKVNRQKPDLIAFTGDFICCGRLQRKERLKDFFNSLQSRFGTYAVLGNHDYAGYVSINRQGDYDHMDKIPSQIFKGLERLFRSYKLTKIVTDKARNLKYNEELVNLLNSCSVQLLHNTTRQISVKGTKLNITGLGEHMLGRVNPEQAFKEFQEDYRGIVLVHNPDALPKILEYPGDLILTGHTHGGQINLPYLWKKFSLLENQEFKKGLFYRKHKWIVVNRGVGSVMPFRLFAPPQIVSITLKGR